MIVSGDSWRLDIVGQVENPQVESFAAYRSDASRRTGDDAALYFLRNWHSGSLCSNAIWKGVPLLEAPRAGETQIKCDHGAIPRCRWLLRDVPL